MGDQVLPSFYAEDATNAMNAERRRDALAKCLRVVKSDIEREKKVKRHTLIMVYCSGLITAVYRVTRR